MGRPLDAPFLDMIGARHRRRAAVLAQLVSSLAGREGRNYLAWRMRRNPFSATLVTFEWLVTMAGLGHGRSDPQPETETPPRVLRPGPLQPTHSAPSVRTIVERGRREYPEAVERLIADASAIRDGQLELPTGRSIPFARPNWRPGSDDQEDLFAVNRGAFGITLAKAWAYTRDPRYAELWLDLLHDWQRQNPASAESPAWEPYSVSERIANWCFCLPLLADAPGFEDAGLARLSGLLAEHADWLASHLETRAGHNHLINNARALFIYGCLFGNDEVASFAWRLFCRELQRQVLADGTLREQSSHYQLLLTRTAVEVCLLAEHSRRRVPEAIRLCVRRMLGVSLAYMRQDASIPIIGDYSPNTDVESLVGVIAAGCAALETDTTMAPPGREHGLWYSGDVLPPSRLARERSAHFSDAGLSMHGLTLHGGRPAHLTFRADPRGEVIFHGHADLLSLTFWLDGLELIVDPGLPSYRRDRWWAFFR